MSFVRNALVVTFCAGAVVFIGVTLTAPKKPVEGRETCKESICVREMLVACRDKVAVWEFEVYPQDSATFGPQQPWSYVRKLGPEGGAPKEKEVFSSGPTPLPEKLQLSQGKQIVEFGGAPKATISYELDWNVTCGGKNPLTPTR